MPTHFKFALLSAEKTKCSGAALSTGKVNVDLEIIVIIFMTLKFKFLVRFVIVNLDYVLVCSQWKARTQRTKIHEETRILWRTKSHYETTCRKGLTMTQMSDGVYELFPLNKPTIKSNSGFNPFWWPVQWRILFQPDWLWLCYS